MRTGERAFYSADTDLIQLTGQPTWRVEQRDGSGDELVFDRTNKVFRANGHARLKMPAQSMGASGFLSQPGPASATSLPPTNQFVEVLCDNYELRTNLAVFREQVRVSDRLGDQLQGEMTCGLMTLTFAGTNELQKMVAEHQVVIAQEDKQFTAEKAEYTGTNGVLDLTGNPAWRAGLARREGRPDAGQPGARGNAGARKRLHEIAGRRAWPVRFHRAGQAQAGRSEGHQRMSSRRSILRGVFSHAGFSPVSGRRAHRASADEVDLRGDHHALAARAWERPAA